MVPSCNSSLCGVPCARCVQVDPTISKNILADELEANVTVHRLTKVDIQALPERAVAKPNSILWVPPARRALAMDAWLDFKEVYNNYEWKRTFRPEDISFLDTQLTREVQVIMRVIDHLAAAQGLTPELIDPACFESDVYKV